ncbi:hypothetical protein ISN45_Aa05g008930 [Arabidopsis thaliana x Arabidopsis arenosa]|uniref:Uncharacterized protein n=1 Tax=Arabidopsis thaliana x Arabidopsis arenosa TaxID=1240361 RepID=A0A8T1ZJE7_9BRAS|nr:hypothetical protein ISN45_Aa05g008930 [Arabidopsis thaliana x Arabidopsis arenosa]
MKLDVIIGRLDYGAEEPFDQVLDQTVKEDSLEFGAATKELGARKQLESKEQHEPENELVAADVLMKKLIKSPWLGKRAKPIEFNNGRVIQLYSFSLVEFCPNGFSRQGRMFYHEGKASSNNNQLLMEAMTKLMDTKLNAFCSELHQMLRSPRRSQEQHDQIPHPKKAKPRRPGESDLMSNPFQVGGDDVIIGSLDYGAEEPLDHVLDHTAKEDSLEYGTAAKEKELDQVLDQTATEDSLEYGAATKELGGRKQLESKEHHEPEDELVDGDVLMKKLIKSPWLGERAKPIKFNNGRVIQLYYFSLLEFCPNGFSQQDSRGEWVGAPPCATAANWWCSCVSLKESLSCRRRVKSTEREPLFPVVWVAFRRFLRLRTPLNLTEATSVSTLRLLFVRQRCELWSGVLVAAMEFLRCVYGGCRCSFDATVAGSSTTLASLC